MINSNFVILKSIIIIVFLFGIQIFLTAQTPMIIENNTSCDFIISARESNNSCTNACGGTAQYLIPANGSISIAHTCGVLMNLVYYNSSTLGNPPGISWNPNLNCNYVNMNSTCGNGQVKIIWDTNGTNVTPIIAQF